MISKTPNKIQPVQRLDEPMPDPFKFQDLTSVKVEYVQWIWKPYIPRAAVTMMMGDGGYGKSWATCAIAADLSAGRALPGQEALPPMRVLMVSAEDGLSHVIKPKMISLQANMENIRASDQGFVMNQGVMDHLINHIKEYDAAIVFLDPLVVYLGGKVDTNKANETRSMTSLLVDVAKKTGVAIVVVHHVRKSGDGPLQHKVMGSADFINSVRSGLLMDVSKAGQRYMAHVKSNWAANGPTLAYRFGAEGFEWMGEYSGPVDPVSLPSQTRRGEIENWIKSQLRNGPVPAMDMMERANEEGYSDKGISKARRGLVISENVGGRWMWRLSDEMMELLQAQEMEEQLARTTPEQIIQSYAQHQQPQMKVVQVTEQESEALKYARERLAKRSGDGIPH